MKKTFLPYLLSFFFNKDEYFIFSQGHLSASKPFNTLE